MCATLLPSTPVTAPASSRSDTYDTLKEMLAAGDAYDTLEEMIGRSDANDTLKVIVVSDDTYDDLEETFAADDECDDLKEILATGDDGDDLEETLAAGDDGDDLQVTDERIVDRRATAVKTGRPAPPSRRSLTPPLMSFRTPSGKLSQCCLKGVTRSVSGGPTRPNRMRKSASIIDGSVYRPIFSSIKVLGA